MLFCLHYFPRDIFQKCLRISESESTIFNILFGFRCDNDKSINLRGYVIFIVAKSSVKQNFGHIFLNLSIINVVYIYIYIITDNLIIAYKANVIK